MSERRKTYEGNLYFVTFAVVGWIDLFTRKEYAEFLIQNLEYCRKNKGLYLYAYCIMPSHIHLIAKTEKGTLSEILRDFKSYTSKELVKMIRQNATESRKEWILEQFEKHGRENSQNKYYQVWQQSNHATELFSDKVIEQKREYIHQNPVEAGLVTTAEYYRFSSANPDADMKVDEL